MLSQNNVYNFYPKDTSRAVLAHDFVTSIKSFDRNYN